MRNFLFSSELDEPFCEIVETVEKEGRQCLFSCQASGFLKFFHLIEKYQCNEIAIKNLIESVDNLTPDLSLIKNKNSISSIEFSGNFSTPRPVGEELNVLLKDYVNVLNLTLFGYSFGLNLSNICEKMSNFSFDVRSVRVADLKRNWPQLKDLRIDFAKGDLSNLGGHDGITSLRLYDCNLDNIRFLESFNNLETLVIDGQKKTVDFSPLSNLSKLNNLRVFSKKFLDGISEIHIPNVKNAFISKINTTGFIDNNPTLEYFGTINEPSVISDVAVARGWTKYEAKRFGLGGAAIPAVIRK